MSHRGRRAWLTVAGGLCGVLALATVSQASTASSTTSDPSSSTSSSPSTSGSASQDAGAATDLAEPQTSAEGVEVRTLGTVTVRPYQTASNPPVVLALHGVQRVDGATVVYWSVGSEEEGAIDGPGGLSELAAEQVGAAYVNTAGVGSVRLVDPSSATAWATVRRPSTADAPSPEPFTSGYAALPTEAGQMAVLYAVLPELPDEVETVDVDLMFGVTIPDVPVDEGYLEPTTDPGQVIPLGTGWPEIDTDEVADMEDPGTWTYPLSTVTEALDDTQVVTETGETVTIDLAADVLFAFDRADLNPQAQAKLTEITQKLVADGATGQVSIVGHTDSQGSDAYNQDLSLRRAQSVAAVLQPALGGQSLTFAVEGRGESEPVADNGNPEGQQLNRRVSITYTAGGR